MLSRCKRLWAALALQALLDGKQAAIVAREFDAEASDIASLLHGAQIMCNKATRFCAQIGWTSMERMLTDFQKVKCNVKFLILSVIFSEFLSIVCQLIMFLKVLRLDGDDSKELSRLLEIPLMPRRVAQVLAQSNSSQLSSVEGFAAADPFSVVQLLQLSIGFEVQVRACLLIIVCLFL